MNNLKKKKKGFTLIELIIVLAVMAIIALIAIPNFTAIKQSSKEKADEQSRAVVERTALMLAVDNTTVDGVYYWNGTELTSDAAGKNAVTDTDKEGSSKLKAALGETKEPQQSGKTYKITISGDTAKAELVNK